MSKPSFRVTSSLAKDIDAKLFDTLKKRVDTNGQVVNVGYPSGKKEDDGTPIAMIAAVHEFGATIERDGYEIVIPERPTLRPAIKKNAANYYRLNRVNVLRMIRGEVAIETALGQLGEMAKGHVQQEIRYGEFTPLAPSTIRRKGSTHPLIDTGNMLQSVSWELGKRE